MLQPLTPEEFDTKCREVENVYNVMWVLKGGIKGLRWEEQDEGGVLVGNRYGTLNISDMSYSILEHSVQSFSNEALYARLNPPMIMLSIVYDEYSELFLVKTNRCELQLEYMDFAHEM